MNISIFILLAKKPVQKPVNVPPICDIQSKTFHSKQQNR